MRHHSQKDYPTVPNLTEAEMDDNSSLKKMLNLVGGGKRVIDFGCATGYLARLLKARGCEVVGIEINEKAAKIAEQFCEQVIVADLDYVTLTELLPNQKFDVAIFGDVLEHLRNPWDLLKEVRQVLMSDGYVVASIPNIAHGAVRLALLNGQFQYEQMGILDNTHLRFFTRQTAMELFERSGYTVKEIDSTYMPVFSGELVPKLDRNDFDPKLVERIEQQLDSTILQFVVCAFPFALEESDLKLKHHSYQIENLPQPDRPQQGLAILERYKQLRLARTSKIVNTTKASIAIITYNHEKYIAQAVESVLMQEVDFDYEIIVSDDCSTDRTPEILQDLQSQYPDRIKLFLNKENIGLHKNFAQTFFACKGEYTALLEGDDYWISDQKLQMQIDFLDGHPDYALCFHNALWVFEHDQRPDSEYCPPDLPETLPIERLIESNCIPTASVIYRSGLIDKIPDSVSRLKTLDWPLHFLHAECGKMGYIDQVMSVYRIHSDSVWSSQRLTWQLKEMIKIMETINDFSNFKYEVLIDKTVNHLYAMLLSAYEQECQSSNPPTTELLATSPMTQCLEHAQSMETSDRFSDVLYGSPADPIPFAERDYVSSGFNQVKPDRCFPNMLLGDPQVDCTWAFLRRGIPHNWYVDERYPNVGFINRDEAHLLYNSALMFRGKRALEIGCWMGWSACHIALAGLDVDVIDPILEQPEIFETVRDSLKRAGVLGSVRLIPGSSPEKVKEIASRERRRWSFMFVDGNHESPHPLNDVKVCEQFAEADALVLFHDLVSPGVSEALEYMRKKGWNVIIYHTMQIMGAAWRGNVQPVTHQPDSRLYWQVPAHLKNFSGNLGQQLDQSNQPLTATLSGLQTELDWLRLQLKSSQDEFWQVKGERDWFEARLQERSEELSQSQIERSQHQAELNAVQAQLEQASCQIEQANCQIEQANCQIEQANCQIEQAAAERSTLEAKLQQSRGLMAYLQRQLLQSEAAQQRLTQSEQAVQALRTTLSQAQKQIELLTADVEKKYGRLQLRKANLELKQTELAEAQGRITAMETSKFWKMRKIWFNVRRLSGLKGQE